MLLPNDVWGKMFEPQVVQKEDGTWETGDKFFDELEAAIARGENIDDVIAKFNTT